MALATKGVLSQDVPTFTDDPGAAFGRPPEQYTDEIKRLREQQLKDVKSRLRWRTGLLWFFSIFLTAQTVFVFWLVTRALFSGELKNVSSLQPVLATLIAGTLAQTYGIVRVMVTFIFDDVPYSAMARLMRKRLAGTAEEGATA